MALKFKVKSKEEIPAEHVAFYAEREGAWVLDVNGAVEKSKLDEFRNTNVALLKERDELKKRFEGIDPEQVHALAEEKRKLEEERILNGTPHPGPLPNAERVLPHGHHPDGHHADAAAQRPYLEREKIEKIVESRLKTVKGDLEKQVSALSSERDALNSRLVAIQIDQGVIAAATKRGLRATAIPDITARARGAFRLVNGVLTLFEADGQTVKAGKDGTSAMTLEEWVAAQVSEAPHIILHLR
jgi:hypothetical protein